MSPKRAKAKPRARQRVTVGGHVIELSHLDNLLFPGDGITEGDLVDYYRRFAPRMLPHVKDRPIMMHRFPDGIGKAGFYQKDVPDYFPKWIKTVRVRKEAGGAIEQVVINDAATLVYLADQACITPHVWLSRARALTRPDMMIFDLDPSGTNFSHVRAAARLLHDILDDLGLAAFVKTTGSRGLHVVVPLDGTADFDEVRAFARDVARVAATRDPTRLTIEVRKAKRRKRVFIDALRNAYGATAVAPFAVRARKGAPVAVPVSWDEVARSSLRPQAYTIKNIFTRLRGRRDPWTGFRRRARGLARPRKKLDALLQSEE
jgi:bifunctional non-homologous end joining protein LigD